MNWINVFTKKKKEIDFNEKEMLEFVSDIKKIEYFAMNFGCKNILNKGPYDIVEFKKTYDKSFDRKVAMQNMIKKESKGISLIRKQLMGN